MKLPPLSLRSIGAFIPCFAALEGCTGSVEGGGDGSPSPLGGQAGGPGVSAGMSGGGKAPATGTGGASTTGAAGGIVGATGGTRALTGGTTGTTGGTKSTSGGTLGATGGTIGTTGGISSEGGGFGTGGRTGGGAGKSGMGGNVGTGGGSTGGASGGSAGGAVAGSAGAAAVDCDAPMPTGGTVVSSNNRQGKAAGLDWTIWSNNPGGSITHYATPAFSASWGNTGDFLARIGLQWDNSKTYDQYGTISAQFTYKRTGTGGGYSYIGIYGWSTNPCVEYYIVDDSFNRMPVNPGMTTNKGMVEIDGGTYIMYTRNTTGTGGSKCSGVSNWMQFYSIRNTARTCGTISITKHFDAWKAAGMTLGRMDQAQIFIETGGGSGTADFPIANVTTTM